MVLKAQYVCAREAITVIVCCLCTDSNELLCIEALQSLYSPCIAPITCCAYKVPNGNSCQPVGK